MFSLKNFDYKKIILCDVGQGDAILFTYKNFQFLIDGGPNEKVLDCISKNTPFWDKKLEVVLLTHPQDDHFTGLIEVFKNYKVDKFIKSRRVSSSQKYQLLEKIVRDSGAQVIYADKGQKIRYGLIYFDILWPEDRMIRENLIKEINDESVVVFMRVNKYKALFTGDLGKDILLEIVREEKIKDIDFLKVPHHGSKNNLDERIIGILRPKVAAISVGRNNSYGHPHQEVLTLLKNERVRIFRTDVDGEISLNISD